MGEVLPGRIRGEGRQRNLEPGGFTMDVWQERRQGKVKVSGE